MKRIGFISHLYAQPLFHGLKAASDPTFHVVQDSASQLAIKLRQQQLDGAFLSPIDYAKDYSHYRIIPQLGVISEGESQTILLFFNEHARQIKTLSIDPSSSTEIILASIVLLEKFDTKVKLIPTTFAVEEALQHTDAYLAVGDTAMKLKSRTNKLDLVDEWKDITDLPFVHGMWVAPEGALTGEEVLKFIEISKQGVSNLIQMADSASKDYLKPFRYDFDEMSVLALNEFFRMAYYHGILKDIPDVKFFTVTDSISSN